ncbi:MAG: YlxM family DNA-binding protein [bacterium]|nr:YlxM family DNA-binding protein [bacterium]
MIDLIEKEKMSQLYDFYKELLTEKQRNYFEMYYFFDNSLGEIASDNNLSRNAIYDNIKKTCKILLDYEEKLHLLEKSNKRNEIIEELEKKYNDSLIEELKNID